MRLVLSITVLKSLRDGGPFRLTVWTWLWYIGTDWRSGGRGWYLIERSEYASLIVIRNYLCDCRFVIGVVAWAGGEDAGSSGASCGSWVSGFV